MRITISAFTATLLLATTGGSAFGNCIGDIVQIGAISRDLEKDTFGRVCGTTTVEHTGAITNTAPRIVVSIGTPMGEPEKDTLGYEMPERAE